MRKPEHQNLKVQGVLSVRPALVFDVETVVDAKMAKLVLGQPDLADPEALRLVAPPRDESEAHGFPKPLYHQVVEIAVCVVGADGSVEALRPLATSDDDERLLLQGFWAGFGHRAPGVRLVTYNGRRFDVPVLLQRALRHGLAPAAIWRDDYRQRFRDSHLDVMDVISDYGSSPPLSQHELATMLGVPGKLGVSGGDVMALWSEGRREDIAAYCTCDVATLTLAFARLGPTTGWCTPAEGDRIEQGIRASLEGLAQGHQLYAQFLAALG